MKLATHVCVLLLAAAPAYAQRLVALDSSRRLYDVDMTSGAVREYGLVDSIVGTSAGLTRDLATGTVYLTSTGNDSVYTVDLDTGAANLIGFYGNTTILMHGIEYDVLNSTLYGGSRGELYTIDTTTGLATLVGSNTVTSFTNLCFDYLTNTMYATESGTDSFYTVDLTTGAMTLVGPLVNSTNPNGLAFDGDSNTIWMVDNSVDKLFTIDPTTGLATEVGPVGSLNLLGLVYLEGNGHVRRIPTGCGTATLNGFGAPNLGGTFDVELTGQGSLPFLGLGFNIATVPWCSACAMGHDWTMSTFGSSLSLGFPNWPQLIGLSIGIQGADLLVPGGCTSPADFTLTDTLVITIG